MKTYQFVILAALLALIVGAMAYSKRKKPCGCGGAHAATDAIIDTTTDQSNGG